MLRPRHGATGVKGQIHGITTIETAKSTIVSGMGFALLLATLSAVAPLWRVQTMKLVDALAGR